MTECRIGNAVTGCGGILGGVCDECSKKVIFGDHPKLHWDRPKKTQPTAKHNAYYSSDSGVAGTYVPNMSAEDKAKWKATKVGGADPRVEIRKTVTGIQYPEMPWPQSAQVLIVVRERGVTMSANSKMVFDQATWSELHQVVKEAGEKLKP